MQEWIAISAGYAFAVVVGHFAVARVVDRLWLQAGPPAAEDVRPAAYLPRLIGIVERCLFVAALQLGEAEFIGVWLALKVAGQWKRWQEETEIRGRKLDARFFYNVFLVGSALSIAYAVVGAQLIRAVQLREWTNAAIPPIALLGGTAFVYAFICFHQKKVQTGAQPVRPDNGG